MSRKPKSDPNFRQNLKQVEREVYKHALEIIQFSEHHYRIVKTNGLKDWIDLWTSWKFMRLGKKVGEGRKELIDEIKQLASVKKKVVEDYKLDLGEI